MFVDRTRASHQFGGVFIRKWLPFSMVKVKCPFYSSGPSGAYQDFLAMKRLGVVLLSLAGWDASPSQVCLPPFSANKKFPVAHLYKPEAL